MEYVGIEFQLSNYALIIYYCDWTSARPIALSICNSTDQRSKLYSESSTNQSIECISGILYSGTFKCYCKRASASTSTNNYSVYGHVFK
jgi:hypothetical protein